jgi:hypothetical protein
MTTSSWLQRSLKTLSEWLSAQKRLRVVHVEDPPNVLGTGLLYLIGDKAEPWCAALQCPCGCKADVRLSLIPTDTPRWKARRSFAGGVTIYPSIWRTKGCRSHFYVFKGRIVWARSRSSRRPAILSRR